MAGGQRRERREAVEPLEVSLVAVAVDDKYWANWRADVIGLGLHSTLIGKFVKDEINSSRLFNLGNVLKKWFSGYMVGVWNGCETDKTKACNCVRGYVH